MALVFPQHLMNHLDGRPATVSGGDEMQLSGTGHPKCRWCKIRFYDAEALYKHCDQDHVQCPLCPSNASVDKPTAGVRGRPLV